MMQAKDFFVKMKVEETPEPKSIGDLIGTYETGHRITCLKAFVMVKREGNEELSEFEGVTEDAQSGNGSSDEDSLR